MKIPYRPEIDGLRAIAVLPVMLFHAGFTLFSGGFIGVDIFFVISGYLITSIIVNDIAAGTFSFWEFYERRARRILPALFVVMFCCIPFAWIWMMPNEMTAFSTSVVSVCVFASNFLFWRQIGYFEAAAELKPLLHTWSLSVEEQFYIIFPISMLIAWRLGRNKLILSIMFVAILSLATSEYVSRYFPSANFYLLPTRAWELMAGSLCSFVCIRANLLRDNILSIFGLLAIGTAIFGYDETIAFSSVYVLLPVLGTCAILLLARKDTLVGFLLSLKPIVSVGLISYSVYLWHQPIFAFTKLRYLESPSLEISLLLCAGVLAIAYLTWRYVETPVRDNILFSQKIITLGVISGTIFFITTSIIVHLNNGYPDRIDGDKAEFLNHFENSLPKWNYFTKNNFFEIYRFQCDFYDLDKYRSGNSTAVARERIAEECYNKASAKSHYVMLWGDSHAKHLYPGIKEFLPNNWDILQVTSSSCEPELAAKKNESQYCQYSNWFAWETISSARPDVVVVAQNHGHDSGKIRSMANSLKNAGVKKVIFIGPTPHWTADLPKIVAFKLWYDTPSRTYVGIDKKVLKIDERLKGDLKNLDSASYVSAIDAFCENSGCLVFLGNDKLTGITSIDYGHLTPIASKYFAEKVLAKRIFE